MSHACPHPPAPEMAVKKLNLNGASGLSDGGIRDSVNRAWFTAPFVTPQPQIPTLRSFILQRNSDQSLKAALVTFSTTGQKPYFSIIIHPSPTGGVLRPVPHLPHAFVLIFPKMIPHEYLTQGEVQARTEELWMGLLSPRLLAEDSGERTELQQSLGEQIPDLFHIHSIEQR